MPNALLLSIGSKVALARIAQQSTRSRGIVLHGADQSRDRPARHVVDRFHTYDIEQGIEALLGLCRQENIGLIIPTRHSDLPFLSRYRKELENAGIVAAVSSPETIDLCTDKLKTAAFFDELSIPAPLTFKANPADSQKRQARLPLIAKPIAGSASQGVRMVESVADLEAASKDSSLLLQTLASGEEYTINVYVDRRGQALATIPHKRLAVSEGESVQAITERHPVLIELSHRIVASLPGVWGPINIQAFWSTDAGRAQVIEINPRLGGGFPLAHQAGGHFIEWLFQESLDKAEPRPVENWTEGLRMLRFRDALFDLP